jgi:hypothetical protein
VSRKPSAASSNFVFEQPQRRILDWVSTRRRRPVSCEAHRDAKSFALNIMPVSQGTRASKGPSSRTAAC